MTKFNISTVWYPLWAFITITIVFSVAYLLNQPFGAKMIQPRLLFSKPQPNRIEQSRFGNMWYLNGISPPILERRL